jgi:hypothetical protein
MGQRRDFEGLKHRRTQAARLFAKAKGRGALAGMEAIITKRGIWAALGATASLSRTAVKFHGYDGSRPRSWRSLARVS